jgi:hypothetical protein
MGARIYLETEGQLEKWLEGGQDRGLGGGGSFTVALVLH